MHAGPDFGQETSNYYHHLPCLLYIMAGIYMLDLKIAVIVRSFVNHHYLQDMTSKTRVKAIPGQTGRPVNVGHREIVFLIVKDETDYAQPIMHRSVV